MGLGALRRSPHGASIGIGQDPPLVMEEQMTLPPFDGGSRGQQIEAEVRDRDPLLPSFEFLERYGALALDPRTAEIAHGQARPRSTAYVADRLLVPPARLATLYPILEEAAREFGLRVVVEDRQGEPLQSAATAVRLAPASDVPTRPPDAWRVLQWVRTLVYRTGKQDLLAGVGLDHLMFATLGVIAVPQQGVRADTGPATAEAPAAARTFEAGTPAEQVQIAGYVRPGSGGRQPVSWLGPTPQRTSTRQRVPVVAILDTGCGKHEWLDPVVETAVELDGEPVGMAPPQNDPERSFDYVGAFDDFSDAVAGHGTFMAGLVHMFCPDADLLALRVVNHDGVVVESELLRTLAQIIELVRRHLDGEAGGRPVDVLVLSMGYYHESPGEDLFMPIIASALEALGRLGVLVVAAAGNDATLRPMLPAALAPYADGRGPVGVHPDVVPVVSVGATNPDGSVALFSNDGPWVRAWESGASVVSTMPVTFHGGMRPPTQPMSQARVRSHLDPDDYSSGFAVWSGTSFAAPVLAGKLARCLQEIWDREGYPDPVGVGGAAPTARAWEALSRCTELGV